MSERSYHRAQWVPHEGLIRRPTAPWANALTTELNGSPMKDRSDDPSHHEQTLLPQSSWVHPMKDRSDDPSHHEWTLLPQSSMGPPWRIDPTTHRTMSERSYHRAQWVPHEGSIRRPIAPWANALTTELNGSLTKDRSDEPSHHERTLLPLSSWVHPMKDRSNDPSHHEQTLYSELHTLTRSSCRSNSHEQSTQWQLVSMKSGSPSCGMWPSLPWPSPLWCSSSSSQYSSVEGRKEIFSLTTLNTFYLRLYGIGHMVRTIQLLFPISSKGSFICIIPQTG